MKTGHLISGLLFMGFAIAVLDQGKIASAFLISLFGLGNLYAWGTYDQKKEKERLRNKKQTDVWQKQNEEQKIKDKIIQEKRKLELEHARQLREAKRREEERIAVANRRFSYVYVFSNPSMPGIVKIGYTDNTPEERAKELSSVTGMPTPFSILREYRFASATKARKEEKRLHNIFEEHRVSNNREFFRIQAGSVDSKIKGNIKT